MTDLDNRADVPVMQASRKRVFVAISDSALRLATISVLNAAGYRVTHLDDGEVRVVTDDPLKIAPRTILFIDEVAGSARIAVDALSSAQLGGIVSRRNP